MNTQSFLFEHSSELSENLYLELMNKLKLDFDGKQSVKIIVVTKNPPKFISLTKSQLIKSIIVASVSWEDREDVLKTIITSSFKELKDLCKSRSLTTMKINPSYQAQCSAISDISEKYSNEWIDRTFI